jgi:NAD(P)-dependent dehydrogenase (short-subunit alcohol dehydrogenase family)
MVRAPADAGSLADKEDLYWRRSGSKARHRDRAGESIMADHVTLITGASRGIGRALADRLAGAGHRVIGIARNAPAGRFPGRFMAVDLADAAATASALAVLAAEQPAEQPIDGLVNNVGLVRAQPIEAIGTDDLAAVLDLNLRAALQATQAVLPAMRARGWGRIVNIASLTVLGARERSSYAAAKAALIGATRGWALELAAAGITVNCIAPGPTETELFRANNPPGSEAERRLLAGVPVGRFGRPAEIAAAITFMLSEEAGFITGQTLFVDGGSSIGKALL